MWRFDFPKLLPRLNSCSCLGQSSLHMVSVLLVRPTRPSAWLRKCFSSSSVFLLPSLHSCSLLCCSSLSPLFHHHRCRSSSLPHYRCTAVTHRISLSFPHKFKMSELRREACAGRGKEKCKISPVPYFSREDLSVFYERGAPPSTCASVMYPSD